MVMNIDAGREDVPHRAGPTTHLEETTMRRPTVRPAAYLLCGGMLLGCCLLTGCNVAGVFAQVLPVADTAPAYPGLKGQTVGVMVWADRGSRIDFPMLQADVARGITTKLSEISNPKDPKQKKKVPQELAGVEYLNPMAGGPFPEDPPEQGGRPAPGNSHP